MTTNNDINLDAEIVTTFSLAAQQNAYPIMRSLSISHFASKINCDNNDKLSPFKNIEIRLTSDANLFDEETWIIDQLEPGQRISLQKRELKVSYDYLESLTEEINVNLTFTVVHLDDEEVVLSEKSYPIAFLPSSFWGGESRQPDLLAAFVKPNGVYVESLIKSVSDALKAAGHSSSLDGYQSNTREHPYMMAAALWSIVFDQGLSYAEPPSSFAHIGQRVRLAADISNSGIAACLDTSLLFASALEAMGMNPVIALSSKHAFVGAWLIDERFPVLINDDPMDLRKRVDMRDLVLFETTLVTNDSPITFKQAQAHARKLISEDNEEDFVYLIDIGQARARQIKPLGTFEEKKKETDATTGSGVALPVVPALPPVRIDERIVDETPDTRIDTWQRKLLDLTKKNNLLNLSSRAVSIKIFCPDIGAMEDNLASGQKFKFLSAEKSPLNDSERDDKSFLLKTGDDIHLSYAREQLDNGILIANQTKKKLEQCSISLFRKAKNDLEEGGSNTLYIALGMLKWKDSPDDERSYRAPLILIPARFTRKSARAPIYVEQIPDEDPIFNLTLIEFLQTEHDIDLQRFRHELPEDESGVDVNGIWGIVREAIREQPGFEVVEELIIASFSFAKYLMWKDLKDRISDLKENPFVDHLVERPQDAYVQDSQFVVTDEVDEKIDPDKIFTPLNCDSSQLVAVEASGHTQDFVLEGPPGTGKSETIANIICHNIALGRKVLFVAEKMAALSVVYRRMDKVGLSHLCLELHSNKSNKKSVLQQLHVAWTKREATDQSSWVNDAIELKTQRSHLNKYVSELHKKSIYGVSPRDVIARCALYEKKHSLTLDWGLGFDVAPIKNVDELKDFLKIAKKIAIVYTNIEGINPSSFDILGNRDWSNAWQVEAIEHIRILKSALADLEIAADRFEKDFNANLKLDQISALDGMNALAQLFDLALEYSLGYAISGGAKERLEKLKTLSKSKKEFDKLLAEIGCSITADLLPTLPLNVWQASLKEEGDKFIKGFFVKRAINKEGVKLGLLKIKDFSLIDKMTEAKKHHDDISAIFGDFKKDQIWKGWNTPTSDLDKAHEVGMSVRQCVKKIVGIAHDSVQIQSLLKKKLCVEREFLDDTLPIFLVKDKFVSTYKKLIASADEAVKKGFVFNGDHGLKTVQDACDGVIENQAKIKKWCAWLIATDEAKERGLDNLVDALRNKSVKPDEAEDQALTSFCRWLAPQLIDASDSLRQFSASLHESNIKDFRELDERVARTTSNYIAALAAAAVPDQNSPDSPAGYGVLSRELQKKTKHKPIRSLIEDMGENLLDLMPCLMMSPLSVAQFLPSDFNGFDLVVFDEASQMTTWDSVGAIARGKNIIVVGDPKQMPPTSFFSGSVSVDDPDEEDMESILDQALAARLPHLRLTGHYRSRHETLIAFSNSKYYENSLITFPAADTRESAVSLHRVEGVYAKGKGRNNPIEARAVVDEVVRRLKAQDGELDVSIGIVTLNTDQQRTIEDLLDEARRSNIEIEPYFQNTDEYDAVFVKNLESVQGDERDVIILSLGYGPVELCGKTMSMNFGPLNKSGGERRLNVAITRATSEVLVFSSFDASMIDLSRTSSTAVEHLKHYLEFADKGPIALAQQAVASNGVDQFDSDFEQAVAYALRDKGWRVQTQIGVSKFKIDLGIIHPDHPGEYLAGVECDGATYHSSPSARDRDRVRHLILENLGWTLVRLWSTDYFTDPSDAIDKIHERLTEILKSSLDVEEAEQGDEDVLVD